MKLNLMKIALLMFVSFGLIAEASAVVCQNKTAIVYSNGMFNDERNAKISKNELIAKMLSYPQASSLLIDVEFHLAYANDNGGLSAGFGTVLEQLLEVGRQALGDTNMDLFWEQLQGIVPADPQLLALMKELAQVMGETAFVNDKDFASMMSGGNGFEGYRTFLSSGKRVLIVSHSQGNYYSNRVYREITDPAYGGNAALASSIGVVAVATPASTSPGGKLGLNEPNITVPEDFVIAGVRAAFGSLPSKSDRIASNIFPVNPFGWSSNVPELGFSSLITQFEQTTLGHNFVGWYLAGPYTRNFIMNGIVDTLNGVAGGYAGLQYPTCKKCLNDTGITSWGNATLNNLTAAQPLFPGQDADYGRDTYANLFKVGGGNAGFDFTKLDAAGKPLANQAAIYAITPWSCVQDNVTGLMWEVKTPARLGGLQDANHTYSWFNSDPYTNGGNSGIWFNQGTCVDAFNCDTEKYVGAVNAASLCGYSDWRLPDRGELISIVDYGVSRPSIDVGYFPNTVSSWLGYWSSSSSPAFNIPAWTISFGYGEAFTDYKASNGYHVRLVRGGQ